MKEDEGVALITNGERSTEESNERKVKSIFKYFYEEKVLPVIHASWISRVLWHWVTPLVRLGYKKPLEANDLYVLPGTKWVHIYI